MAITQEDILSVLESISEKSADGFTTEEFCDALGVCRETGLNRLRKLIAQGSVELAGKRAITTIAGAAGKIPVYRMKKCNSRSRKS